MYYGQSVEAQLHIKLTKRLRSRLKAKEKKNSHMHVYMPIHSQEPRHL